MTTLTRAPGPRIMRLMPRCSRGDRAAVLLGLVLLSATACGYHLAGRSTALPPGVTRVAIPTFVNRTNRPQIEQRITEHIIDEMTTRGRLRIVARQLPEVGSLT